MGGRTQQSEDLSSLLRDIEEAMVARIPPAIPSSTEEAYCLFICYHDTSVVEYTPYFFVGHEWCRRKFTSEHADEVQCYIWFQQEVELVDTAEERNYCDGFGINKECERARELMCAAARPDEEEEQFLVPFRSAMYRVAQPLNKLDWRKVMPVTDDFVVVAIDSIGYWIDTDVEASVPPERLALLKSRGFWS